MSVFTFAPMRAALPRAATPAVRPQRLAVPLPSFTGMRMSKLMPLQIEGAKQCNLLLIVYDVARGYEGQLHL